MESYSCFCGSWRYSWPLQTHFR